MISTPQGEDAQSTSNPDMRLKITRVGGLLTMQRSVEIDLKKPEGRELFLRLAERADVVLENFRVGTVDKLGIGHQAIAARNPSTVEAAKGRSP